AEKFRYGQYGIHLGQQDVLTFLGDANQIVYARFIDCRKDSPTFRIGVEFCFSPATERTLIIPPGVAHTFQGLENVFTLNAYDLFLPSLKALCEKEMSWSPENDIINIPEEVAPQDVPGFLAMTEEASDLVCHRLGELQENNLGGYEYQHAETRDFIVESGEAVTLRLREKSSLKDISAPGLTKIDGVFFRRLPHMVTGDESGIVPLTRRAPMYLVEHGAKHYDFDSYGLHLGQEDHLVFLGDSSKSITLKLVDMREGSATKFVEDEVLFNPSPWDELVIPCGVAHAFFNMENVVTVNRPVLYVDEAGLYLPGHDVIDWPLTNTDYVGCQVNTVLADDDFYMAVVAKQREIVKHPTVYSTPKSVVIYDEFAGQYVKVVLREKTLDEPQG
uniref:dTDP-4-dehydrorhamnose 3,5-epimerase family protein n=1 Tax=Pseudomonas asplenii TaxID=53407 RepID=UPI0003616898